MRKHIIMVMAVVAQVLLAAIPAQAGTYYGTYSLFTDRRVDVYIDAGIAENRDGWCVEPGGSRPWQCFVDTRPRGAKPEIVAAPKDSVWTIYGKDHVAKLTQPYPGWKPYCYPTEYNTPRLTFKRYFCAYWVPVRR
ncbi:hypothetical protein [Lentzea sp. HUAS12]|uniref:hypothetical protein n=1 Tax=Lentzea sp. HUAS12 TaxID=2951806 RepID=UPI0020A03A14|nr:hypothetical protein [Lentzea sp. HUAS12]USX56267.1 hypothetical protein ND450_19840 [Lentzea sp. HUAS12]